MNRREEILDGLQELPKIHMAVKLVISLLEEPDTHVEDIAGILEYDPALTVSLLSMVNTHPYDVSPPIVSVKQALSRLDAQEVIDRFLSKGVQAYPRHAIQGYGLRYGDMIKHSMAVAIATRQLALELGIEEPPHAFTSGLLINFGKAVMDVFLLPDRNAVLDLAHSEMISFVEAEKQIVGVSHVEISALLLEKWNIPDVIVQVVRHHRRPHEAPYLDPAMDLVHAGDMIARSTGIGIGVDGLHYELCEDVIKRLKLTPEIMENCMAHVNEYVFEMFNMYFAAGEKTEYD